MVDDLPGPARRFFRFAIRPGTPLRVVAEVSMSGELSLGRREKPNYLPMRAEQVLAVPYGFVWKVRAGNGVWIAGSDCAVGATSWSRFWLLGIVPVARAGHNADHARSAFGRSVAEALFWTPAALLPGAHVRWQSVDDATARVIVAWGGLEQAVDVCVDGEGRLTRLVFPRWSDANPAKRFQLQPFGGTAGEFREFAGFRLPTRVEGGNFFGTADYFPFFKANVSAVRFPPPGGV